MYLSVLGRKEITQWNGVIWTVFNKGTTSKGASGTRETNGVQYPECCFHYRGSRATLWKLSLQLRGATGQESGLLWRDMANSHDQQERVRGINTPTLLSACPPASCGALHWWTHLVVGATQAEQPPGEVEPGREWISAAHKLCNTTWIMHVSSHLTLQFLLPPMNDKSFVDGDGFLNTLLHLLECDSAYLLEQ